MKTKDLIFIAALVAVFTPIFLCDSIYEGYKVINGNHPYMLAFIKFALLSTLGESISMRIKMGSYNPANYGLLPRAILWGLFGIWIAIAMKALAMGTPYLATSLGIKNVPEAMAGSFLATKLLVAFMISVMMNTTFGPVFMTLHKITDTHILNHGGSLKALITPINMSEYFQNLNWKIQWGFVFKKTIPLFWFPAHTITFMLPAEYQVLFAAALSIALGVILSVAAVMSRAD